MIIVDPTVISVLLVTATVLGLVIGSFLNVVVWRVPRGESVISPPSACPNCRTEIRRRDNVPILSWLILRGRCRDCSEPISVRYPLVELVTGMMFLAVTAYFVVVEQNLAVLPAYLYLAAIGVALTLIDYDTHRLPNSIVLPSYVVAIILLVGGSAVSGQWERLLPAAVGGVAMYAFYFLLAIVKPGGMGFGDVKLAGVLGLYLGWLGWPSLIVGAFAAFVLGGVVSIVLLATRRAGRNSGIPFGPWMIGGAAIGIFFGANVAGGYLSLVGLT